MEKASLIVSLAVSFVAVGVSVLNVMAIRKQVYSALIGKTRIEHSTELRELIFRFIELHIGKADTKEIFAVRYHINLYLNPNKHPSYAELSDMLQLYCQQPDKNIEELIPAARAVLQLRWENTKLDFTIFGERKKMLQRRIDRIDEVTE